MTRIRSVNVFVALLNLGAMLIIVSSAAADEVDSGPATRKTEQGQDGAETLPRTVEQQLHLLTEKLKLDREQQAHAQPILQGLYDALHKLEQDETLSHEERASGVRASRQQADNHIRTILNDDQKKMLDQLEREPRFGLHGDLGGPTIDQQLNLLTKKLNLADDQQAGVNSMLQRLHDALQKIERDESLSRKERLRNSMSLREQTDKDIRSLLNDDQKKKLDQVEREPHPKLHG
jgi:hypothetical protein